MTDAQIKALAGALKRGINYLDVRQESPDSWWEAAAKDIVGALEAAGWQLQRDGGAE